MHAVDRFSSAKWADVLVLIHRGPRLVMLYASCTELGRCIYYAGSNQREPAQILADTYVPGLMNLEDHYEEMKNTEEIFVIR